MKDYLKIPPKARLLATEQEARAAFISVLKQIGNAESGAWCAACPLPRSETHGRNAAARASASIRGHHKTLGHSQISLTLNTYRHVLPALQADAAAKLDAVLSR